MPASTLSAKMPWTGRDGRFSVLRFAILVLALAPAFWMALKWNMGWLSPKPVTDILRESGDWAMRFIVAVLAITPLRYAARWNKLIAIRRLLGVAAAFYMLLHLFFYFIDQNFVWWRIAVEIVIRLYLTIGVVALGIFLALAATSNDAMVKKLGAARWSRLHTFVYLAAFLAIVHYFMQVRLKAYEPSLIAGLLVMLAAYRVVRRYRGEISLLSAVFVAMAGALSTAVIEAGYYRFSMNAPFMRVFESNLDFSALEYSWEIRPAWYVLAAGLLFAAIIAGRAMAGWLTSSRSSPAPAFRTKTGTAPHR